jgi:Ulp1 family protease
MPSSPLVSYHSCVLYEEDVRTLLEPKSWLNDAIIAFVEEFFEKDKYKCMKDEIEYISPSVVMLLLYENEFDFNIKILEKGLVFFPLNNALDLNAPNCGTHWSLLVYLNKTFYHLDSSRGSSNLNIAERVAARIRDPSHLSEVVEVPSPQQSNSFDCGTFVLYTMDLLSLSYQKEKSFGLLDVMKFRFSVVVEYRSHLSALVSSFTRSGQPHSLSK